MNSCEEVRMIFKRYLCHFSYLITCIIVLFINLLSLQSYAADSVKSNYQLTKLAKLEHQLISHSKWQQFIVNPSNNHQYFVINESGQVYLIDGDEVNSKAVLDMSAFEQKASTLFKLTAIELHPNFSLRDQIGYGTFYTAHTESLNKNSQIKRLKAQDKKLQLHFDSVITEWKFSAANHQRVDVNTKREVLRIGVPDSSMVIKQMSFSPYVKSWNDNFGLLYVGLSGKKKSQPLYSGVVLRINPAQFGLRNFTIPSDNPYLKNNLIHDAIYLLGGEHIEQFIWPEKNNEHILVSHQNDKKYLLSLSGGNNDWRNSDGKQAVFQSNESIDGILMYQGSNFPSLRSKLLILRKKEQHWFIDSLALNISGTKKSRDENKVQQQWKLISQQLSENSQTILSHNYDDEILLLNKNVLFHLTTQPLLSDIPLESNNVNASFESDMFNFRTITLAFSLILIILAIFYWLKRRPHSAKSIVRQQFASLELSESSEQIGLYRRHQRHAERVIDIVDIISSEIQLNEHSVATINSQLSHGFNSDKEQNLRTIFAAEKVEKMVDGKVRQISLRLTDKQNASYWICVYMRKGNNRMTKKPYTNVINELMDWCWFIGEQLNKDEAEERKLTIVQPVKAEVIPENSHKPLHNQAAKVRQVVNAVGSTSQPIIMNESSSAENIVRPQLTEQADKESETAQKNHKIDTELVNALDKLVSLKKQGFLTMDEFLKAKEELLKNLLTK